MTFSCYILFFYGLISVTMCRQRRFLTTQRKLLNRRFAPLKSLFTNPKSASPPPTTPLPIPGIIAGSVIGGIAVVCILAFGWYKFKTYQPIQPIRVDTLPRHIKDHESTSEQGFSVGSEDKDGYSGLIYPSVSGPSVWQ